LPVLEIGDWDAALLERLKNGRLGPADSIEAIRYESWQPPLYYIVAAQVFRVLLSDSVDDQVRWLRIFDVLLGAVTLGVAYTAGRRVFGPARPWLVVAVPTLIVGVPMFTAVSAAITDDALSNLLAALLTLQLLRLLAEKATWPTIVALGVVLGLGVLTKLLLALFAPIAVAVLLVRRTPLRQVAAMGAIALAVVAPWLVRQSLTYGLTDILATERHNAVVADQPRFPGLTWDYASQWATTVFHSAWAQFGWMAIPMPDRLYWSWGILTLAGVVGVLMWLGTRQPIVAGRQIALLATIALACGVVLVGYNLTYEQAQGRYLFPALVPLSVLLVLGWSALVPRRARQLAPIALAIAFVIMNAYVLLRVLPPAFSSG
jgi:4-amino-4-deoxy-L-arabinose transferase-like glycosyltransferase